MAIFTGAGVAIVTPFKDNLEVDYNKLEQFIDYQVENGTDSIIICGTTGEASTLTHEEHLECIRVAVNRVNKRIPVIAGTGSNCTETAKYLSKEACKAGVDGLLLVTPYYNKATQKGLVEHFSDVAHSVDAPILLYNVPGRTGCNLAAKTTATLVNQVENIVGIKEASGNMSQIAEIMLLTEGKIDLYSGNDDQILPLLSLGGKGVISVLSNIAPKDTHDIVAKYMAGDQKGSLELQLKYLPLIKELFCEVNPIPVKKAVELAGFMSGTMRKPLTEMEPENAQHLEKEMKAVGIL
ncbi:4-hydroxy-tetrahydrodipicolinate synthase [Anaerosporobacter faecicola]|uniref:4-hydroxy-tetrahydrodipicolinate synthase n=1 Tax=Anaerosporobacter faecicola TaxID=2718714 RepID=UPI0014389E43|nr:4-hydroxy-tetrahydrodipicolinate synthase [Anaerosporobacter faecicola]